METTRRLPRSVFFYLTLAVGVGLFWSVYYRTWPMTPNFSVPVVYQGDATLVMGVGKGLAHLPPPWNLHVADLNAPFGANWNDYPLTEKLIYYYLALLDLIFPVGVAANLALLTAHLTAAWGFAWSARRLGAGTLLAAAGAFAFAFCPYMMWRSLPHLVLTYDWMLPVMFPFIIGAAGLNRPASRRQWLLGLFFVAVVAWENPYYFLFIEMVLGLTALRAILRRARHAAVYVMGVAFTGFLAFVADQLNVFLYSWKHGPNPGAVVRDLHFLIVYGLRLPDLFLPVQYPWRPWFAFAWSHYFSTGVPINEDLMAFLGAVGCLATIGLFVSSLCSGLRGRCERISLEAWIALFAFVFAVAGGLDYLLGSIGFDWLRAPNRYSIVILCAALLWLCRTLQRVLKGRHLAWPSLLIIAMVGAEALGMRAPAFAQQAAHDRAMVRSDQDLARTMERLLPAGANVFQLPVADFPEQGSIHQMTDYEHFRVYLWSHHLRFSYGSNKGRLREAWQKDVQRLPADEMVDYLERHGFDAIMVNRAGFADHARALESALKDDGDPLLCQSSLGDLVVFRLTRTGSELPEPLGRLQLGEGWWPWESSRGKRWCWSKGPATLLVLPGEARHIIGVRTLRFDLGTVLARSIGIEIDGRLVRTLHLAPGETSAVVLPLPASPRPVEVRLTTDVAARQPDDGDDRALAFQIVDPIVEAASPLQLGEGWWRWEWGKGSRWCWSKGSATLYVGPGGNEQGSSGGTLRFRIGTILARSIRIEVDGKVVKTLHLPAKGSSAVALPLPAPVRPVQIRLLTDEPAHSPRHGDARALAFRIIDPVVE